MSLTIYLIKNGETIYRGNITHNLNVMSFKLGVYDALWRAKKNTKAKQLIELLTEAIKKMKKDPSYYRQFNPANGWGDYEGFLKFLKEILVACCNHPDAIIEVER